MEKLLSLSVLVAILLMGVNFGVARGQEGPVSLVRTILEMPKNTIFLGGTLGSSGPTSMLYFGGRFIFAGDCGGKIAGAAAGPGGGLWSIKEDGSGAVEERDRCIDGGAANNSIYFHGKNYGGEPMPDGERGIVIGNATAASCLSNCSGNNIAVTGPGASRSVYYGVSASGLQVQSRSPSTWNQENPDWGVALLNQQLVAGSGHVVSKLTKKFASIPSWAIAGSAPSNLVLARGAGFGDYIIGAELWAAPLGAYKIVGGSLSKVQDVPGAPTFPYYSYDYSSTPKRLAIYQPKTQTNANRRLLIYEEDVNGLRLVKDSTLPSDFPTNSPNVTQNGFAIYGEYLLWPAQGGFTVWRGTEQVGAVTLPNVSGQPAGVSAPLQNIFGISVARGGYIAALALGTPQTPQGFGVSMTGAYLYRFSGVIGGGAPPASTSTVERSPILGDAPSFMSSYLQGLQDQINKIRETLRRLGIGQ